MIKTVTDGHPSGIVDISDCDPNYTYLLQTENCALFILCHRLDDKFEWIKFYHTNSAHSIGPFSTLSNALRAGLARGVVKSIFSKNDLKQYIKELE